MARRTPIYRPELIARAIERLADGLASNLQVTRSERAVRDRTRDTRELVDIYARRRRIATLAIDAKRTLTPREAELLAAGRVSTSSRPEGVGVLVVAPWLSLRTRQVLAEAGANYADLTGNTLLRVDDPVIFVRTDGATRDPSPAPRKYATLRGPRREGSCASLRMCARHTASESSRRPPT